MLILKFIKFHYVYFRWWLRGKYGNFLAKQLVKMIPNRPTEDSLAELFLQQIVWANRNNEIKRYDLWLTIIELGSELGYIDSTIDDEEITNESK